MLSFEIFVYIAAVKDFPIATEFLNPMICDSFEKITELIIKSEKTHPWNQPQYYGTSSSLR
jgi:hypothetical protein